MSWHYDVSEDEQRAADELRAKGWDVRPPTCPECHGWGYTLWTVIEPNDDNNTLTSKPCTNGCAPTASFFASIA